MDQSDACAGPPCAGRRATCFRVPIEGRHFAGVLGGTPAVQHGLETLHDVNLPPVEECEVVRYQDRAEADPAGRPITQVPSGAIRHWPNSDTVDHGPTVLVQGPGRVKRRPKDLP